MKTKILVLWALPRSRSTAFEWMMRQRGDFNVSHEPFTWTYYFSQERQSLREHTTPSDSQHNFDKVWGSLLEQSFDTPLFIKDFSYCYWPWARREINVQMVHTFLIRKPEGVLTSLDAIWPDFALEEAGYSAHRALYERIALETGAAPAVIDSDDLIRDPEGIVSAYCDEVEIPFMKDALSWEPGARKEVSAYPGNWHAKLRESSGFQAPPREQKSYRPIDADSRLQSALELCLPHYDWLYSKRLKCNV